MRAKMCGRGNNADYTGVSGSYGRERNIWEKLQFSFEIAQHGKNLISIFRQFAISVKKISGLGGRLAAGL